MINENRLAKSFLSFGCYKHQFLTNLRSYSPRNLGSTSRTTIARVPLQRLGKTPLSPLNYLFHPLKVCQPPQLFITDGVWTTNLNYISLRHLFTKTWMLCTFAFQAPSSVWLKDIGSYLSLQTLIDKVVSLLFDSKQKNCKRR